MAEQNQEIRQDDLVDALRGTRALVGVIAQSLTTTLEHVTLPQFRALVLLRALGVTPAGMLAARLGVTASTGTRLVSRLVRGGWVERGASEADRRLISLTLTDKGIHLVDETRRRRERALDEILRTMRDDDRAAAVDGLRRIADAAGEPSPESLDVLAYDRPSES
jgi:DNA-binding MarR family transcriptional regulator